MEKMMISASQISSVQDTNPVFRQMSWEELVESCRVPVIRGALPLDEYLLAEKGVRDHQKNGPALIAGTYSRPGTRHQRYLASLSLVVLDLDDGFYSFEQLCEGLGDFEAVVFTSYSHSPEKPKLRAYLPLLTAITGEIKHALERIVSYFDDRLGHLDPACYRPGQLFFLPACPPDGEHLYQFRHLSGYVLNPAYFQEMQPPVSPRFFQDEAPQKRVPNSTKPGDLYNATANWKDLLEPLGWRHFYGPHYTRPGKRVGVSGSILDSGFYIHSSSPAIAPFLCGKTYTLFGAFTAIYFGGDHSAAARHLRTLQYE